MAFTGLPQVGRKKGNASQINFNFNWGVNTPCSKPQHVIIALCIILWFKKKNHILTFGNLEITIFVFCWQMSKSSLFIENIKISKSYHTPNGLHLSLSRMSKHLFCVSSSIYRPVSYPFRSLNHVAFSSCVILFMLRMLMLWHHIVYHIL